MKYALVTGGSRGIGRAVAIRLSQAGIPVVINYVQNETAATETKAEIEKAGGQAELLRFDVSQPEEIEQAINAWEDAHPDDFIGVLVAKSARHNAQRILLHHAPTIKADDDKA